MPAISIIMPAYRAEAMIARTVRSLIAQTFPDWELLLVADDGADYGRVLASEGIADPRIRLLSSGGVGMGAARARNVALEAGAAAFAALLDADDLMKAEKLALMVAALEDNAIVSTALEVTDTALKPLRLVAAGADRPLAAGEHKWVNISMDTMIGWDRRRTDARFDSTLSNMADLDFLIRLYERAAGSFHLGRPLHIYVKQPDSMSNKADVTERMIASKAAIRERLGSGYYRLADPAAAEGLDGFLAVSMAAEAAYPAAKATRPGLLFEDHLDSFIAASRR
ncbi:MAG TPA: glycosyltransferase [Devosia sp.]|nr:glycosyltransferase [Devosia sp.]